MVCPWSYVRDHVFSECPCVRTCPHVRYIIQLCPRMSVKRMSVVWLYVCMSVEHLSIYIYIIFLFVLRNDFHEKSRFWIKNTIRLLLEHVLEHPHKKLHMIAFFYVFCVKKWFSWKITFLSQKHNQILWSMFLNPHTKKLHRIAFVCDGNW